MENYATKEQLNDVNAKLDTLLEYVNQQRLQSERIKDLISDLSIISKDAYDSSIEELENQMVEIEPGDLRILFVKLLKNINNIKSLLGTLESVSDFAKDAQPIVIEMMIDASKKLSVLEEKGYFEFFSESGKIVDNIVTNFTSEDLRQLADNIVGILQTIKNLTQPEMLSTLNNAVDIFSSLNTKDIPEYSIWRVMREINSPEMKKGLGLMMTFLKNISKQKV
jgi:uncharacterized protein YjgD (DUF1641 family)